MGRGFRFGWLIVLAVIAIQAFGTYFEDQSERPSLRRPRIDIPEDRRPDILPQPEGRILPGPSSHDRVFTIETGPKSNSTGTAFAVRDDGVWITARHVVDGCDRVGLVTEPRRAVRVDKVQAHPYADMAVLWTRWRAPALSISREELRERQAGYHFGFPQSEPGQVTSALLGRRNMRTTGRYRHTEPVVAWAETARVPDTERLGGISGGPALNEAGEIIGVTVASSQRRGRVFTTAPLSMEQMLSMASVQPQGAPSARLNTGGPRHSNFVEYGSALRRQLTVAKVICLVDDGGRRRSWRR